MTSSLKTPLPEYPAAAWVQAQVAINVDGRVLITRGTPVGPWTMPFDLVSVDETVEEVVCRLVREYVDADAGRVYFMAVIERGSTVESDDHGVTLLFEARLPTASVNTDESLGEVRWVTWPELGMLPLHPPQLATVRHSLGGQWQPLGRPVYCARMAGAWA